MRVFVFFTADMRSTLYCWLLNYEQKPCFSKCLETKPLPHPPKRHHASDTNQSNTKQTTKKKRKKEKFQLMMMVFGGNVDKHWTGSIEAKL